MEKNRADGDSVHQAVQRVVTALSQLDAVLTHSSERGRGLWADGDIVKSDDADIARHLIS